MPAASKPTGSMLDHRGTEEVGTVFFFIFYHIDRCFFLFFLVHNPFNDVTLDDMFCDVMIYILRAAVAM